MPPIALAQRFTDIYPAGSMARLTSLADSDEVERRKQVNKETRTTLENLYDTHGLVRLPSHANFVAIEVGDAESVSDALLAHGVITRPLAGFGTPELLRVTIGSPQEMERFAEAFTDVLSRGAIRVP